MGFDDEKIDDNDQVMDKTDEEKTDNENRHKDDNNKEEDKNTEKAQDGSTGPSEEHLNNDADMTTPTPPDGSPGLPEPQPNDDDTTTPPLPDFLPDGDDTDLLQVVRTNKDKPNGLKTPSPSSRQHSKRLQQITPDQDKEHKQKSSKLNNTGATDPLKSKDE